MKKLLLKLSAFSLVCTPMSVFAVSCSVKTINTNKKTCDIEFKQGNDISVMAGNVIQIEISNIQKLLSKGYRNLVFITSDNGKEIASWDYSQAADGGVLNSTFTINGKKEGKCTYHLMATNLSTQEICEGDINVDVYSFSDTKIKTDYGKEDSKLDIEESLKNNKGKVVFGSIENWSKWKKYNITSGFDVSIDDSTSLTKGSDQKISQFFSSLSIDDNGSIYGKLNSSSTGEIKAGSMTIKVSNSIAKLSEISQKIYYNEYTSADIIKLKPIDITSFEGKLEDNNEYIISEEKDDDSSIDITALKDADLSEMCSITFNSTSPFTDESILKYDNNSLKIDFKFNDSVVKSFAAGSFQVDLLFYTKDNNKLIQGTLTINYPDYIANPYDDNKSKLSDNALTSDFTSNNIFDEYPSTYASQTKEIADDTTTKALEKFKEKGYLCKDLIVMSSDDYDSYSNVDLTPVNTTQYNDTDTSASYSTLKNLDSDSQLESINSSTNLNITSVSLDSSNKLSMSFGPLSTDITAGKIYVIIRCIDEKNNYAFASAEFNYSAYEAVYPGSFDYDTSSKTYKDNNGSTVAKSILMTSEDDSDYLSIGYITLDSLDSEYNADNLTIKSDDEKKLKFKSGDATTTDNKTKINVLVKRVAQKSDCDISTVNVSYTYKGSEGAKIAGNFSLNTSAFVSTGTSTFYTKDSLTEGANVVVSKENTNRTVFINNSINKLIFEDGYSYKGDIAPVEVPSYSSTDTTNHPQINIKNGIEFKGKLDVTGQAVILQENYGSGAGSSTRTTLGTIKLDKDLDFTAVCKDSSIDNAVLTSIYFGFNCTLESKSININTSGDTSSDFIGLISGQDHLSVINASIDGNLTINNDWSSAVASLNYHHSAAVITQNIGYIKINGNLSIKNTNVNNDHGNSVFTITTSNTIIGGDDIGISVSGNIVLTVAKGRSWLGYSPIIANEISGNSEQKVAAQGSITLNGNKVTKDASDVSQDDKQKIFWFKNYLPYIILRIKDNSSSYVTYTTENESAVNNPGTIEYTINSDGKIVAR